MPAIDQHVKTPAYAICTGCNRPTCIPLDGYPGIRWHTDEVRYYACNVCRAVEDGDEVAVVWPCSFAVSDALRTKQEESDVT